MMSRLRQFIGCLAAVAAVAVMAQNPPPVSPIILPPGATNLFP